MAVVKETGISGPLYANGVTTVFPFDCVVASAEELAVEVDGVPVDPEDYAVTLSEDFTGSITISPALAAGEIYIYSIPNFKQEVVFQRFGPFYPDQTNAPFDRAAIRDIYLKDRIERFSDALELEGINPSTLRTELASTAPNKGAVLMGFKQPLPGAVDRTAYDKFLETVSVKDFGAIGDGVADDTAAVQLALLSGVASIYVPKGRYRVTSNLTRDGNTLLHGDGLSVSLLIMEGTSSLLFDGGAAGDEFGTNALQIERLGFEVTGSTNKTVISAIWAAGIGGTSKTVTVRDVQIVAGNAASTFGKALYLKNARNVLIDNMRILGDRDGPPIDADFGIDIFGDDDGAPVEIYMRGVLAYYCVQPFNIAGWVEGVNFDQCAAINCRRGIKAVATTTSPRPWVRVSGCHINTDTAAIELTNFVQFIVNGNLIYATDFDAVSAAYSAITVDGQNASMDSLITDNILQCLLTGVAKNGIVIEPGDIASDDNVTISRNVIVSFDTGIVLQANTTGVRVADDNDIRFCADDIADLGDNLVCIANLSASNGSKKSLDGFVEKWGSNVVALDANGDGTIAFSEAFGTLLVPIVVNGDPTASVGEFIVNTTGSNAAGLAFSVRPNPGAISVRVNWRAVGSA